VTVEPFDPTELCPVEERVLEYVATRQVARLSDAPPAIAGEAFDAHDWQGAAIRGEFVRALLLQEIGLTLSKPEIAIHGARIQGPVDLDLASLDMHVAITNSSFESSLRLQDARLRRLTLDDCSLRDVNVSRCRGEVMQASGAHVLGTLWLEDADFVSVKFDDAVIESAPDQPAIAANVLRTSRSARFARVTVAGPSTFIGVGVGGQLVLRNASFSLHPTDGRHTTDGLLLTLHEACIDRSLYLRETRFDARVSISGTKVGGRLDARGASFLGTSRSLDLKATRIERSLQLDDAHFSGQCRAENSRVGDYLSLASATFGGWGTDISEGVPPSSVIATDEGNDDDPEPPVVDEAFLDLTGAVVAGALDLRLDTAPGTHGLIRLGHASVGLLRDAPGVWKHVTPDLDGFRYGWLPVDSFGWTLEERITWIDRQEEFSARPYEELGRLLRDSGRRADARTALFRRDKRARRSRGPFRRAIGWFFEIFAGYGYRLGRVATWLLAVWLLGGLLWHGAWNAGVVVSSSGASELCPPTAACFHALALSADTLVPVVRLGQADQWHIQGSTGAAFWYRFLPWALIGLGWLLTTAAVAGFGRLLSRE